MDKTTATTVFESLASGVRLDVFRLLVKQGTEGLVAGDIVVTAGQLKLREGAPVRAIGDGAPPAPPAAGTAAAK